MELYLCVRRSGAGDLDWRNLWTRQSLSTCCWDFLEYSCSGEGVNFQPRATPGESQPFRLALRPVSQKSEWLAQERRKKGRE